VRQNTQGEKGHAMQEAQLIAENVEGNNSGQKGADDH